MGPKVVSLLVAFISLNSVFAQSAPTSACVSCVNDLNKYFDTATNTCVDLGFLGYFVRDAFCSIILPNLLPPTLYSATAVCDPFNCPVDPPSTFAYNETTAKNVYWRLQGALKLEPTSTTFTQCTKNAASDIIFVERINVTCGVPFDIDTCITDVYVIPSFSQILSISRGSNGASQIVQMAFSLAAPVYPLLSNGSAITYFQDAASRTWNGGLETTLETLLNNTNYSSYKFVAAGHSLGGPQAIIFASLVGQNRWRTKDQIEVYTTGQPRMGDLSYMKSIYQYAPQIYRIINNVDLIPITPLRTVLNLFGVQHTNWAIRYDGTMTGNTTDPRIQCTWPEDPNCMGYSIISSLSESNHNTYFGQDVTQFYTTGCVY